MKCPDSRNFDVFHAMIQSGALQFVEQGRKAGEPTHPSHGQPGFANVFAQVAAIGVKSYLRANVSRGFKLELPFSMFFSMFLISQHLCAAMTWHWIPSGTSPLFYTICCGLSQPLRVQQRLLPMHQVQQDSM